MIKGLSVLLLPLLSAVSFAADAFPKGQSTPEGAACELARAFISKDAKLFRRVCLPDYGPKDYVTFLDSVSKSIKAEAKKKTPSPGGPKKITDCYASRNLSANGPASYGYATFGFNDVKFVDVKVELVNGQTAVNRTLVIQGPDKKWYVHPAPAISPLLSAGLNQESASTVKVKAGKTSQGRKQASASC